MIKNYLYTGCRKYLPNVDSFLRWGWYRSEDTLGSNVQGSTVKLTPETLTSLIMNEKSKMAQDFPTRVNIRFKRTWIMKRCYLQYDILDMSETEKKKTDKQIIKETLRHLK